MKVLHVRLWSWNLNHYEKPEFYHEKKIIIKWAILDIVKNYLIKNDATLVSWETLIIQCIFLECSSKLHTDFSALMM